MNTFGEQQEKDRLFLAAVRHCWMSAEGPIPTTMRPMLEAVGVVVPPEIVTTGDFLDHFDAYARHCPK